MWENYKGKKKQIPVNSCRKQLLTLGVEYQQGKVEIIKFRQFGRGGRGYCPAGTHASAEHDEASVSLSENEIQMNNPFPMELFWRLNGKSMQEGLALCLAHLRK